MTGRRDDAVTERTADAMQIIDSARRAYLRDELGWDDDKITRFQTPPAGWVVDAVVEALERSGREGE